MKNYRLIFLIVVLLFSLCCFVCGLVNSKNPYSKVVYLKVDDQREHVFEMRNSINNEVYILTHYSGCWCKNEN